VSDLPGGHRGYLVLATAQQSSCSNQAALAQQLGIDRTVMTYLVDDLERAGLVERRPDPADRRSRRVVLTDASQDVLATAGDRVRSVEASVLGALSDDDATVLRHLLVSAAAGQPAADLGARGEVLPTTC
jgi:DNA-binding MarR family transcriptional regulator